MCPNGSVGSHGLASTEIVAALNKPIEIRIAFLAEPVVLEDFVIEKIDSRRDQQKGFHQHPPLVADQVMLRLPYLP